jgi:hypothetical protein
LGIVPAWLADLSVSWCVGALGGHCLFHGSYHQQQLVHHLLQGQYSWSSSCAATASSFL